jgi:hypothetical protein
MKEPDHIPYFFAHHANGRFMWITHNYGQAQNNQRAIDEQLLKVKNE